MNTVKWKNSIITGAILALFAGPAWSVGAEGEQMPMQPGQETQQVPEGAPGSELTGQGARETSPLFNMTAAEIIGMKIVGARDKQIGEVVNLVLNRQTKKVEAVIATGQILGLGGKQVIMPLNELLLEGDVLRAASTEEELKQRPVYTEDATRYSEVTHQDRPVGEFAAFEAEPKGEQEKSRPFEKPAGSGEQMP